MNKQTETPETDSAWMYPASFDANEKVVRVNVSQRMERERDEAREALENYKAESIHTCHEQCQRPMCVLRRERDKAREDATNYYAKIGELTDSFLFLQREAFEMREAIIATLEENRHLADGDDCTLAKLKSAVPGWK